MARRCDRIVANCPAVRDFYVQHGLPAEKIRRHRQRRGPGRAGRSHPRATPGRIGPAADKPLDRPGGAVVAAETDQRRHLGGRLAQGDSRRRPSAVDRRRPAPRPPGPFPRPSRDLPTRSISSASAATCRSGCRISTSSGPPAATRGNPTRFSKRWRRACPWSPPTLPARATGRADETGYLAAVGHRAGFTRWTHRLLDDAALPARLGEAGRERSPQRIRPGEDGHALRRPLSGNAGRVSVVSRRHGHVAPMQPSPCGRAAQAMSFDRRNSLSPSCLRRRLSCRTAAASQ